MKAKNFKPFNMRTHESLREETEQKTGKSWPAFAID
jgi:hypothetical protein